MACRTVLLVLGVSLLLVQLVPSVRPFPLEEQGDKVTDTDLQGQDNTRMDTLNRILKSLMVEKRRFGCGSANCGRPCYKDDDGTVICGRAHYRRDAAVFYRHQAHQEKCDFTLPTIFATFYNCIAYYYVFSRVFEQ